MRGSWSELGLGCEVLGGTDWGKFSLKDAVQTVRRALQNGISFFDTADVYGLGRSEEVLTEALGEKRKDVTICSKFGVVWRTTAMHKRAETHRDCRPERVYEALENSLRRLRLDRLPLYLMHWPDPAVPIEDTMAALCRCHEQGKVGGVGVSNCSAEQIRNAHKVIPLSAVQLPLSLISANASAAAVDCCRELKIPVMCYGPLSQGLLAGKYGTESCFGKDDRRHRLPHFDREFLKRIAPATRYLQEVGARYGKTPAQVALRWVLDSRGVTSVIVGAKTPRQLNENLGALGWKLAPDDWQALAALFTTCNCNESRDASEAIVPACI